MSAVVWQDLCVDALDVDRMSQFWAAVIGLDVADPAPPARLSGPTGRHTVWVNQVDRPRRAKNRTHLDIDCASIDDLVDLGATVTAPAAQTGLGWTRMVDPEGNDFCAFVRDPTEVPAYRLHGIAVDCDDPKMLAIWWGEVFGVEPTVDDDCWTLTGVAVDDRMTFDFNAVPEPRTEPNRVHWDVRGDVDRLLARGASRLWDMPKWTVLADPEGNEFCVFRDPH
ncbi:VOC family protein [Nocardioides oleivorans]|uniref:VOC family protein n=1 Tax=Nocardioides oleivorans TaxID=273676 RepID=A0A4Q2RRN9_9ACTN|nr:VOC family protein [Nocardioides oleivorans]RYB91650.1 VOC family protein [Nocardioides oleivorans]